MTAPFVQPLTNREGPELKFWVLFGAPQAQEGRNREGKRVKRAGGKEVWEAGAGLKLGFLRRPWVPKWGTGSS